MMVWAVLTGPGKLMPMTDAELIALVFALAMVRSRTIFPVTLCVPAFAEIPTIWPVVPAVLLVVPFTILATVLSAIVTVLLDGVELMP